MGIVLESYLFNNAIFCINGHKWAKVLMFPRSSSICGHFFWHYFLCCFACAQILHLIAFQPGTSTHDLEQLVFWSSVFGADLLIGFVLHCANCGYSYSFRVFFDSSVSTDLTEAVACAIGNLLPTIIAVIQENTTPSQTRQCLLILITVFKPAPPHQQWLAVFLECLLRQLHLLQVRLVYCCHHSLTYISVCHHQLKLGLPHGFYFIYQFWGQPSWSGGL